MERSGEQTEDLLRAIYRWHSDLYVAMSNRATFGIADGSFLCDSDELSDGRATTHLRATLIAAVDHFAASNALVQGPPPMYATAALIRGCIEASATVVWLLDAETMIEHLERVALLDLKSVRERHEFIGDRDSAVHNTEREFIRAWATEAGVAPAKLMGRGQTIEQVVRFAGDRLLIESLFSTWRLLSGVAHGLHWATSGVVDHHVEGQGQNGRPNVRLSVDKALLVGWELYAVDVLSGALELWKRAASTADDTRELPAFTPPPSIMSLITKEASVKTRP